MGIFKAPHLTISHKSFLPQNLISVAVVSISFKCFFLSIIYAHIGHKSHNTRLLNFTQQRSENNPLRNMKRIGLFIEM